MEVSEKPIKVLVCGGRNFNDALTLGSWLGGIHKQQGISLLIEGGAPGADFMARKFAEWQGIPTKTFEADWDRHGRAASPHPRLIARGGLAHENPGLCTGRFLLGSAP